MDVSVVSLYSLLDLYMICAMPFLDPSQIDFLLAWLTTWISTQCVYARSVTQRMVSKSINNLVLSHTCSILVVYRRFYRTMILQQLMLASLNDLNWQQEIYHVDVIT